MLNLYYYLALPSPFILPVFINHDKSKLTTNYPLDKINGRRNAPPIKWFPKNRKVWFWWLFTTPVGLTLAESSDFE